MAKVIIAGGTGFVGGHLTKRLKDGGHEVSILSRKGPVPVGVTSVPWDGVHVGPWMDELEGADAVINLSGSSISQKWTPEARTNILQSRVQSTQAIGRALESVKNPPKVWVNASAIGFYGDRGDTELSEASTPGRKGHFLVDTGVAWEAIAEGFRIPNVRLVLLRTGIVLGKDGGAFPPLLKLTRFFLGGHHGSGDQYMSWIHIDDLVHAYIFAIESELEGPVNATCPDPCSNRYFMAALRAVVGRPWAPPAPVFLLKLANMLGAPDPSLLTDSMRVLPKKLEAAGFKHQFPALREALTDLTKD